MKQGEHSQAIHIAEETMNTCQVMSSLRLKQDLAGRNKKRFMDIREEMARNAQRESKHDH